MQRTAISYRCYYPVANMDENGNLTATLVCYTAFNAFNLAKAHKMFTRATGYGPQVIKKIEKVTTLYEMPDECFFTNSDVKGETVEEVTY